MSQVVWSKTAGGIETGSWKLLFFPLWVTAVFWGRMIRVQQSLKNTSLLHTFRLAPGNKNRLFRIAVQSGNIHGSGEGARGGGEILELSQLQAKLLQLFGQVYGVGFSASGMGGDDVRGELDVFLQLAGKLPAQFQKGF